MPKERQFDFFAVVISCFGVEAYVAEFVAGRSAPITMRPGAHHERIGDSGILALGPAISFEGTEQIFRIEPTADGHDRAFHVLEVGTNVASLPKGIVRGVG